MTKTTRLRALETQYQLAKTKRDEQLPAWRTFSQLYNNREHDRYEASKSRRKIAAVFSNIEVLLAAASTDEPRISVLPRNSDASISAMIAESVLDYWFERFRIPAVMMQTRRSALITGVAWTKTAWVAKSVRGDRANPVKPELIAAALARRDELASTGIGPLPTDQDIIDELREQMQQLRLEEPKVAYVSPVDMLFDPQAPRISESRWLLHEYWRPLSSVRRDKALHRERRSQVEPTGYESVSRIWDRTTAERMGADVEDLARIRMYEMWDIETGQLLIWGGKVSPDHLLYDDPFPYAIGHPFTPVECFDAHESPWPLSAVELICAQAANMNHNRELVGRLRNRLGEKWLMRERLATEDVIELMEDGLPGDAAVVPDDSEADFSRDLLRIEPITINPEHFRADTEDKDDIEYTLGINNLLRGVPVDGTRRSAAEIGALQRFGAQRIAGLVANFRWSQLDVARKLIGLGAQFMTVEDVTPVRGSMEVAQDMRRNEERRKQVEEAGGFTYEGQLMYPFNRAAISGEFMFKLDTGPRVSTSPEALMDRAMSLMQTLGQFPEVNRAKLIEEVLMRVFGISNPSEYILPPGQQAPPPGAGISPTAKPVM